MMNEIIRVEWQYMKTLDWVQTNIRLQIIYV